MLFLGDRRAPGRRAPPDARAEGADRFGAALEGLEGGGDDEGLFDDVCHLLGAEARTRDRILLVLMENLDALLG